MVWDAFLKNELISAQFYHVNINSKVYIPLLEYNIIPIYTSKMNIEWFFSNIMQLRMFKYAIFLIC